jgi:hypothetical protein
MLSAAKHDRVVTPKDVRIVLFISIIGGGRDNAHRRKNPERETSREGRYIGGGRDKSAPTGGRGYFVNVHNCAPKVGGGIL